MKLEKGMYVRTLTGKIKQIENIGKNHKVKIIGEYYYNISGIKKASHNIIDLIEVGDIVNSEIVTSIRNAPDEIEVMDERYREEEDINSILTKEQYEKYAYKVKG